VSLRRLAALLALALLTLAALPAAGGAATPRADFNDIEDEVMCDTCNVPLFIAESPRADQLRREIRSLIARGQTKDEVKATLKTRYGAAILALPEDEGFSLAAYLVPILVALGLLALLVALLPRWRRRAREPALADGSAGAAISVEDEARLDAELARFDGR
jgi:cytochrome c-type biogenesis protein CcmH